LAASVASRSSFGEQQNQRAASGERYMHYSPLTAHYSLLAAQVHPRAERTLIVSTRDPAARADAAGVRVFAAHEWLLGKGV
jgi:hypothetical protein